jgi:ABC-type antimicrobial peptide transport system permease subunit
MSSLNKARISPASLNVKRLSLAVIDIARLTFVTMAADSGVPLWIILERSSFGMRYLPHRL